MQNHLYLFPLFAFLFHLQVVFTKHSDFLQTRDHLAFCKIIVFNILNMSKWCPNISKLCYGALY